MCIRFVVLVLLLAACRSGEIACPEIKSVKLRKKPGHYIKPNPEEFTASADDRKMKSLPAQKKFKTINSIEEWDCPRPGANVIPRSVKQNIKKNRKKFEESMKPRLSSDSVSTSGNSSRR